MVRSLKRYYNLHSVLIILLFFYFVFAAVLYEKVSLIFLTLSIWGFYLFFKNSERKLPQSIKVLVILFLLLLVSITFSIALYGSLEKFFEHKYENFRDLIFIYFIAVLLTYYRFEPQVVFKLSAVVSLYALLYVIAILFVSPERGIGLLETPIQRGNMGMLVGVMALISYFGLNRSRWKLIALIGFFSGVLLSILSGSRGGWLTIIIVFLTLLIVFYKFDRKRLIKAILLVLLFLFLLILFWSSLPIQVRVEQAISDVFNYFDGNYQTSVGYRLEMWKASWLGFVERPIFGWGFESFEFVYKKHLEEYRSNSISYVFGHPHNDYMLFLVEMGVIGLVVMLSIFIYPLIKLFDSLKKGLSTGKLELIFLSLLGIVLVESVMEFMISDQTITKKYIFHFYIVFILLIFSSLYSREKETNNESIVK